ncbi:DUF418 domain-containing protein [Formosa haliotis]|uniref:DUF418 domain-containing protein n=1 Tax=Formosa haliotis TaxID=1555194 RepID=UPI00082502B1|nr:DUF418 domain-containing protein [Formosa haliotis]
MKDHVNSSLEKKEVHPVKSKDRIITLDVLRGFAVLGILLMNIIGFGMLSNYDQYMNMINHPDSLNFWMYTGTTIFFEGKMRALFCMLFGAGIMLFVLQKSTLGKKGLTKLFYIRMFWLVVFGLIHAHLLLWSGDILYFYGVFGMIVYLFRNMKPKYKAIGIPIVAVIGFVVSVFFYQGFRDKRLNFVEAKAVIAANEKPTEAQLEAIKIWEKEETERLRPPVETERIVTAMQGTYSEVAAEVRPQAFEWQTKYIIGLLGDNVALMLLGMALLQWGFFSGKWTNKRYKIIALIGYGIGLPLVSYDFYQGILQTSSLELMLSNLENIKIPWYKLIYPVQRILLSMAHASVVILFVRSPYFKTLKHSLKAVGQMAFTNYILQTVLCTLFFFGYGLGYYNKLEFYQLFYVVLAVWVIELIVSPIWLKYYKFGPMEWLWRSLTYRKFQPMRRQAEEIKPKPIVQIDNA